MRLRILLIFVLGSVIPDVVLAQPQQVYEVVRFSAPEAGQAVAVDGTHFYAIANTLIAKYDKQTGQPVQRWTADADHPLKHLNSGIIHDGRLYCAHSNFPDYPDTSSIEVFDTASLQHVDSHSLGIMEGSLTTVEKYQGKWWAVFAHYTQKVNDNPHALDHRWTSLVRFDEQWRREAGWVFPREVLDRFTPHSCSGAGWGTDGKLYCTGHDLGEVYRLELPQSGSVLKLLDVIPVKGTGQGICWDPTDRQVLWGIDRPARQVLATRIHVPQESR